MPDDPASISTASGSTVPTWSTALLELLERQESIVEELAALALRQAGLIEQAETDALLELLAQRQDLISRFVDTQTAVGRLTDELDARLPTLADAERQRIQGLIGSIGDHLARVMARDAEDQHALETARGSARDGLGVADTARQARQAYRPSRTPDARFADRRG